jgi:hypothetical protein
MDFRITVGYSTVRKVKYTTNNYKVTKEYNNNNNNNVISARMGHTYKPKVKVDGSVLPFFQWRDFALAALKRTGGFYLSNISMIPWPIPRSHKWQLP